MGRARDLLFGAVQAIEQLASFRRQGGQDFGTLAAHAHQAYGGLGVGLGDALEDDIYGVGLGVEPRRLVISIAAALAIIHDYHGSLQRHLDGVGMRKRRIEYESVVSCTWVGEK